MMDKKKILLVDDEPEILLTTGRVLNSKGYAVSTARNGREALDKIKAAGPPDLLILDIMMPVMDGYETLEYLRSHHYLEMPVIFLSAKGTDRDVLQGYQVGADYYISKPFSNRTLLNAVEYLIGDLSEDRRTDLERRL